MRSWEQESDIQSIAKANGQGEGGPAGFWWYIANTRFSIPVKKTKLFGENQVFNEAPCTACPPKQIVNIGNTITPSTAVRIQY